VPMTPTSVLFIALALLLPLPALAGPPYVTDDPAPTDYRHYEIYVFGSGTHTADGTGGATGLDISYGAAPDLQLSVTLPIAYDHPRGSPFVGGPGNIEIATKYRFLHQEDVGVDVAVFPRIFLPSISHRVGEQHATFFLPVWIGKHTGSWGAFGGGGCAINRGGGSRNYCLFGWAVTYKPSEKLEVGVELYHQTPGAVGARHTTSVGVGAHYDVNETFHLVGSIGSGIQNASQTNQMSWYTALLLTF